MNSIIRVSKRDKWTTIENQTLRDSRLSFAARGLLCYLLSRPDNWTIRVGDLVNQSDAGRDAVYKWLKQLEDNGYLKRERKAGEGGKFEWEFQIFEVTQQPFTAFQEMDVKPFPALPDTVAPDTAKPHYKKERDKEKTINKRTNGDKRADLPEWLDKKVWNSWLKFRKEIRHPITPEQSVGQFKVLEKFRAAGMNPNEVIEQSIANGWQGLFALPKGNGNGSNGRHVQETSTANNGGTRAQSERDRRLDALRAQDERVTFTATPSVLD